MEIKKPIMILPQNLSNNENSSKINCVIISDEKDTAEIIVLAVLVQLLCLVS